MIKLYKEYKLIRQIDSPWDHLAKGTIVQTVEGRECWYANGDTNAMGFSSAHVTNPDWFAPVEPEPPAKTKPRWAVKHYESGSDVFDSGILAVCFISSERRLLAEEYVNRKNALDTL